MIARIKGLKRKKDTAESSTAPKPVSKQLVLPVDATISYGGWQPHTALHMEEVYEFLSQGTSKLSLSSDKLFTLHQMLDLQSVAKEAGYLEYVRATTNNNIEIRYFEDGLFILESTSRNPELTTKILKTYHDNSFIPALRYLFSQDVPMPGLQNHTLTNHPVVVALTSTRPREFEVDPAFGAITSQITSDDVTVFKTQSHIFIVSARRGQSSIRDMVEMQVFFREFQNQLEYFHTFQRKSWNRVNTIGNRELIKPAELMQLQNQLSAYQKSINLAEGRLEQMDAYIQTRAGIAEQLDLSDHLLLLFHYRFEALEDTYHYLLHSWKMTRQLADQTSNTLANLQSKSTQSILSSMRLSIAVLTMVALSAIFTREISILSNFGHIITFAVIVLIALLFAWIGGLFLNYSEFKILPKSKKRR